MSVTIDEAEEILEAIKVNGKRVYMLEQLLYSPAVSYVHNLLKDKKMGRVLSFIKIAHRMLDPSSDQNKLQTAKLGIDATRSLSKKPEGFELAKIPKINKIKLENYFN